MTSTNLVSAAVCLLALQAGCDWQGAGRSRGRKPDIIWIVWDTVRSDHLSLYGYDKNTTPNLDEWAHQARVFENCVAPGSTTVPAHASMFTGLLPTQHGVSNEYPYLDDALETIAELLRAHGYATYAYSENPFITVEHNFVQGFSRAEQPSDPQYRRTVRRIVLERMRRPEPPRGVGTARQPRLPPHALQAPEVLQGGVEKWLAGQDPEKPVFVFLNYMGAHEPLFPAEAYRRRMMSPAQVERSYAVQLDWVARWLYTFRLIELSPADVVLIRALYDAAILELDDHFQRLLGRLAAHGRLENAVVILTSDHGEHLGEHHMLDHQFSVYEELLRVPLVIWSPERVQPGRDTRPVALHDLFPTVLELAGIAPPAGHGSDTVSLLKPRAQRVRMAEYPAPFDLAFDFVEKARPNFDRSLWERTLRAYYDGHYKLIRASRGRPELYDVVADPGEYRDLSRTRPELVGRLSADLEAWVRSLQRAATTRPMPELSPEHLRRLRALGYAGTPGEDEELEREEKGSKNP